MVYKRLFIDSDVLLDLLLNRKPFSFYTQGLLFESENKDFKLSTSTLVIANINYILSKEVGHVTAKKKIKDLIKAIAILPFESDILDMVLNSSFTDFEDGIQQFIAVKFNCDAIITRNIKDYKHSIIPVLTADQFLNTL